VSTLSVDDDELVARARDGDADAFGQLVGRHRTAVYRAALAAVGSHPDAEDAAQDAFVVAYRRLATFRGESTFKTWLLTIAWHQAINRRRALSRMWRLLTTSSPSSADHRDAESTIARIASGDPTPERTAEQSQLLEIVQRAIRGLPPPLRDALLLVQSGEYAYGEIAAMLRVPLGTLKWRVSEGRRRVKADLARKGYGDVAGR
jgi:RNA polymerase sigma-70 factor, ECF subfamily